MRRYKLIALLGASCLLSSAVLADTLTFVAQPVAGGGFDNNWFNGINWFVTDTTGNLVPAGRVPLVNETAIITGTVDLQASGVRVQELVATNNATVTNGTVAAETLRLLSGSSLRSTTANVLTSLGVQGTNVTVSAGTLSILSLGSGAFQPAAPGVGSTLVLDHGAVFQIGGSLSLSDGAQISVAAAPQNKLVIQPGALLLSTNASFVAGSATNHLIIDNSGTVRADGSTLTFTNGIDWLSSSGIEQFQAASPTALILFASPFQVDALTTSLFTGTGTNCWSGGASMDGVAQVGVIDSATQVAGPANLQILGPVSGAGTVHVVGTTNQGGAAWWANGAISLPGLSIDPGALLSIGGVGATSRFLSGCVITNQGNLIFSGGALGMGQSASITNLPGAAAIVQGDGALTSTDGTATFYNGGLFQKLSAGSFQFGATNQTIGPAFNNSGRVDLQNGELCLSGGDSSGEFHQAAGTLLWFWGGTYAFETNTTFTGNSHLLVAAGPQHASCQLRGPLDLPQLEIGTNGTVTASGAPAQTPIQFGTLLLHDNGVLSSGLFQAQSIQMRDQSRLLSADVNIGSTLAVSGTNCVFDATIVRLPPGASGLVEPSPPNSQVTLTLARSAQIQIGGQLSMTGGAVLTSDGSAQNLVQIQPGGVLASTNSVSIYSPTNGSLVVDNGGLILVGTGTLTLGSGLQWVSSAALAEFNAATPGAAILFTGPFTLPNGATSLFTGPGTNQWLGGGTINGIAQVGAAPAAAQPSKPGNLQIASSFGGSGSIHVLGNSGIPGQLYWTAGSLGLSHLDTDPGASIVIGGPDASIRQLSAGALNNSGFCLLVGGDLRLASGATIINFASGTLDFRAAVVLGLAVPGSSASLNNSGALFQSATGASLIEPDFANAGRLEIRAGTLAFQGAWTQTQGSTTIDSGASIVATNMTVTGGLITGTGTIAANLVNTGGTLLPGGPSGVLSIASGGAYQQAPAASLSVTLAGINPGTQYSQVLVGGPAALNGQLQVTLSGGFVPQPGQSFQLLTSTSLTGNFSGILTPPSAGNLWVARYSSTNLTLLVATNATTASPFISGGSLNLPINTTPGVRYVVEATAQLNPAAWQTLSTVTGDGNLKVVSDPINLNHRFYRVLLQ